MKMASSASEGFDIYVWVDDVTIEAFVSLYKFITPLHALCKAGMRMIRALESGISFVTRAFTAQPDLILAH
jgi:hypothetical protein